MKPERWEQINELFQSAADRAPQERAAFLKGACGGDERLRREVESLIAYYDRAENFIERPAFAAAPELLTEHAANALIGQLIGHYRIESLIGVGGMGELYLARDERLGRKVALKFLPERLTADKMQLSRFKSEARTASALNHPNILTVYEIGEERDRHFIATEFIEGATLRASLGGGKMTVHDALEVAMQLASALAAAHDAGVVHRDIKPENIMLRRDGYVKVLDFGIAKLTERQRTPNDRNVRMTTLVQTHPGLLMGTVRYMSPEQMRGQPADARSDIWSLGVVIYEMVGGVPPFSSATPSDCIASVLRTEPPSLSSLVPRIPIELQSIVQKALRKNRNERYQTTAEVLADLRALKEKLKLEGSAPKVSEVPEKSIAVLPFENLSADPNNTFFADAIQDEILTDLSNIADLKVISRTSVMQYKTGVKRNLREIANELGVAHIVEGNVQAVGNRVRVRAQLIDARTDRHVWAERYDRPLDDIFAIQTDIAKAIAEQLQAKLSPAEKAAIEQPPTTDLVAYDRYLRAKKLLGRQTFDPTTSENNVRIIRLLEQAVARDPMFLLAQCELARAHGYLYFVGFDHSPSRLALAKEALSKALHLAPDRGEPHLAAAWVAYNCHRDYETALSELAIAQRRLPNDSSVFELPGYIARRQGDWKRCISSMERACEVDPRNLWLLQQTAQTYWLLRHFPDMARLLNRTLAVSPGDAATRLARALIDLESCADAQPAYNTARDLVNEDPAAVDAISEQYFYLALCRRDANEMARALASVSPEGIIPFNVRMPRSFCEGLAARARGDAAAAEKAFNATRVEMENLVREQPDHAEALCMLGMSNAALGRKEEALREGRRAVELLPVTKDAMTGAELLRNLAIIYAWTGEKDLALRQLEDLLPLYGPISYGQLRLHPWWDPLRDDPRFEKLVEEAKQPVTLK
jgi:eukaryotic-like serine/threonine-protein kinase